MARRVKEVPITMEGRDKGKTFVITEMPATKATKWAARALLALSRSGAYIPEDLMSAGMAGVAVVGLQAFAGLKWDEVEPLMDEMFSCIQIKVPAVVRALVEEDIEEVSTHLLLRAEVFNLHTGFSIAAKLQELKERMAAVTKTSSDTPPLMPQ